MALNAKIDNSIGINPTNSGLINTLINDIIENLYNLIPNILISGNYSIAD